MISDINHDEENQVPAMYNLDSGWTDKAHAALKLIGEGCAADVAGKMAELEGSDKVAQLEEHAEKSLNELHNAGLIEATLNGQSMFYYAYKPAQEL